MKKSTILLITVLFMLIGYAAYNTTVNIYGLGKLSENISDFKVYLSNLKVNGAEISGINNAKDEFTISDINGDVTVDIVNDSTEYDTEAYLECDKEDEKVGTIWNFDYTGAEQVFTTPTNGTYKLEVWGAQGGKSDEGVGGYGGYSNGNIMIEKSNNLFINIGGVGIETTDRENVALGGYNGGGPAFACGGKFECGADSTSAYTGSGGGATHIATTSGVLADFASNTDKILIVSGGGGGNYGINNGGSGGGISGNSGIGDTIYATGGTQTAGGLDRNGCDGSFGLGSLWLEYTNSKIAFFGSGGGGGFYGGARGFYNSSGAGGGSGYIGNALLSEKSMYCYNCTESNEVSTKTISTTCVNETATANCAKSGNGYARITLLSSPTNIATEKVTIIAQESTNQSIKSVTGKTLTCKLKLNKLSRTEKVYTGQREWTFDYTGEEQTFIAPVNGTYKLEVWGAQGGSVNETYIGGYGGYSVGNLKLTVDSKIYINVGGAGAIDDDYNATTYVTGGYNGGGTTCGYKDKLTSAGGGATHIAKISGLLSTLENKKNDILIVSGGGGGAGFQNNTLAGNGGSGGGFKGEAGTTTTNYQNIYTQNGASQISGGSFIQYGAYTYYASSFGTGGGAAKANGNATGGGGGFYGGGLGNLFMGAGGGSGYIGNSLLSEKSMYCYNCTESTEESTKTISTTCTNTTPTEKCAKQGNGYARITLFEQS